MEGYEAEVTPSLPWMQVQVELANLLSRFRVLGRVKLDTFMPHMGMFHLCERDTQQLLVDTHQSFCHHVEREILDQFVLVHGKLALLHLVHVVGQVPSIDLSIKLEALHQALPLLQCKNVFPFLDSNGLQSFIESICKVRNIQIKVENLNLLNSIHFVCYIEVKL